MNEVRTWSAKPAQLFFIAAIISFIWVLALWGGSRNYFSLAEPIPTRDLSRNVLFGTDGKPRWDKFAASLPIRHDAIQFIEDNLYYNYTTEWPEMRKIKIYLKGKFDPVYSTFSRGRLTSESPWLQDSFWSTHDLSGITEVRLAFGVHSVVKGYDVFNDQKNIRCYVILQIQTRDYLVDLMNNRANTHGLYFDPALNYSACHYINGRKGTLELQAFDRKVLSVKFPN
jgi:hypothetical protein